MAILDKKTLEYLAELARMDLAGMDEEKLVKDLGAILAYFEELEEVSTDGVEPLAGGTREVNVMRGDQPTTYDQQLTTKLREAFREREGDFLKVLPIFDN